MGGMLSFGEADDAPAITVTMRDERCAMLNLDPDSATPAPEMLKAVVRRNQNNAGIYGRGHSHRPAGARADRNAPCGREGPPMIRKAADLPACISELSQGACDRETAQSLQI